MTRIPHLGAMTVAAALIAAPVFAQQNSMTTSPTPGAGASAATSGTGAGSSLGAANANDTRATGSAMRANGDTGNAAGTAGANTTGFTATNNGSGSANANKAAPNPDNNSAIARNGEVRASKIIGSSVYNDQNDKIGTVDDILMSGDDKATTAVISVGGFLGIGSKLVAVPYSQLKLSNDNKVVMPGASKDALNKMPTFTYRGDTTNRG